MDVSIQECLKQIRTCLEGPQSRNPVSQDDESGELNFLGCSETREGHGAPKSTDTPSGGAHMQIIAELRTRLSESSGAQAGLALDVQRLSADVSERAAVNEAQVKRMGMMSAKLEQMRQRIEALLGERAEARRAIQELTQRSLDASALEERYVAESTSWKTFALHCEGFIRGFMEQRSNQEVTLYAQHKELILLRSQARMWAPVNHVLKLAGLVEVERDQLREALTGVCAKLEDLRAGYEASLESMGHALEASNKKLNAATRRSVELEQALCREAGRLVLPPINIEIGGHGQDLDTRWILPPTVPPTETPGAQLALEQAQRRAIEEELRLVLDSNLSRIEQTAREMGAGCELNGEVSEGHGSHKFSALERRHASLQSSYNLLQKHAVDHDERSTSLRQDLQDLQHYIAHMETELYATGHTPTRPQQTDGGGAARPAASASCFMCQQHVPAARNVKCTRCSKVYHKSCCGFPKNEASFICCVQQPQPGNGRSRAPRQSTGFN